MEQLVIEFSTNDGFWDCREEKVLFEYSSKEEAFVDFVGAWEEAYNQKQTLFKFLDCEFVVDDFCSGDDFHFDGIYTLDEWFNVNKINS